MGPRSHPTLNMKYLLMLLLFFKKRSSSSAYYFALPEGVPAMVSISDAGKAAINGIYYWDPSGSSSVKYRWRKDDEPIPSGNGTSICIDLSVGGTLWSGDDRARCYYQSVIAYSSETENDRPFGMVWTSGPAGEPGLPVIQEYAFS